MHFFSTDFLFAGKRKYCRLIDHLDIIEIILEGYLINYNSCTENFSFIAARAEIGEFVEYDLDNEDEDWLFEFNEERKILTPET